MRRSSGALVHHSTFRSLSESERLPLSQKSELTLMTGIIWQIEAITSTCCLCPAEWIYISLRADPETLEIAKNNGGFDSSAPLRSSNAYESLSTEYEVRSNTMVITANCIEQSKYISPYAPWGLVRKRFFSKPSDVKHNDLQLPQSCKHYSIQLEVNTFGSEATNAREIAALAGYRYSQHRFLELIER
ncbi:hypothetical protein H106_06752 [Trichophyton rubrum CBS 735.88]|nr:hypothetical protein H106_06752 [Trichophyton rubrum CBS 735.88]